MSNNPATNSALRRTLSELVIAVQAREQDPDKLKYALEAARKALYPPAAEIPAPDIIYLQFGRHWGSVTLRQWNTLPFVDGVQYTRTEQ